VLYGDGKVRLVLDGYFSGLRILTFHFYFAPLKRERFGDFLNITSTDTRIHVFTSLAIFYP
jgi:hypothetical protein